MPYRVLSEATPYFDRAGTGAPVVLLHHYFGTSDSWLSLFDLLRRHLEVIAPDLRAHRRSSDPGDRLTLNGFTRDIAELLGQLGLAEAHLVGASFGAMVAARLALSGTSERSLAGLDRPAELRSTLDSGVHALGD